MARLLFHFYAPRVNPFAAGVTPLFSIEGHKTATLTLTSANLFPGHQVEFDDNNSVLGTNLANLPPFATCLIEERNIALGTAVNVAWGLVDDPRYNVQQTGEGSVILDMPNITDECLDVLTGLGYVDQGPLRAIVADFGALTTKGYSILNGYSATGMALTTPVAGNATGWSAQYLDDGTFQWSAAPVLWAGGTNVTASGNSLSRNLGGVGGFDGTGAFGIPGHTDNTRDNQMQWQIVTPIIASVGFGTAAAVQAPAWGFALTSPQANAAGSFVSGTYQVFDAGVAHTVGSYLTNSLFAMAVTHPGGVPTMTYYVNGAAVYTSTTPVAPFYPVALIGTPGGTVDNVIVTRLAATGDLWWQVRSDKETQVGALTSLSVNVGMYVRQARDGNGNLLRAFELGPMAGAATCRLVDGRGGDLERMKRNPDIRIVTQITDYHTSSVKDAVTVTTPLGAGQGASQVNLDLLWRIVNDASYRYYGKYGQASGSVFPEYDGNVTLWRVATPSAGYEYYVRYESALVAGGLGYHEGGPASDPQFAYPQLASEDQQILVQRGLYKAAVERLKRSAIPHTSIAITTLGTFLPPKAGDLVTLDYTRNRTDVVGPWTPLRLTGQYRLMSATRQYDGEKDPIDTLVLSNTGKYDQTPETQQAEGARKQVTVQVVEQTKSSVFVLGPTYREIDAQHPVEFPFFLPPTLFQMQALYFSCFFYPFRQPVSEITSDFQNPPGTQIFVTIGGVDIVLPASVDLAAVSAQIGGAPTHWHRVPVASGGFNMIVPATGTPFKPDRYVTMGGDGNVADDGTGGMQFEANGHGGSAKTGSDIHQVDLVPTAHGHPVLSAGKTIAHIPAETALAPLPTHVHPLPPGIKELGNLIGVSLDADNGSGAFLPITASVQEIHGQTPGANGFTSAFTVECSRFVNSPGKLVRLRVNSVDPSVTTNGRGAVCLVATAIASFGGIGQIAQSQQ